MLVGVGAGVEVGSGTAVGDGSTTAVGVGSFSGVRVGSWPESEGWLSAVGEGSATDEAGLGDGAADGSIGSEVDDVHPNATMATVAMTRNFIRHMLWRVESNLCTANKSM